MATDVPSPPTPVTKPSYTHRWVTKKQNPERYHTLCRVIPKAFRVGFHAAGYGSGGFRVVVEFEDGVQVEAPRAYIRSRTTPKGGGWQEGKMFPRNRRG